MLLVLQISNAASKLPGPLEHRDAGLLHYMTDCTDAGCWMQSYLENKGSCHGTTRHMAFSHICSYEAHSDPDSLASWLAKNHVYAHILVDTIFSTALLAHCPRRSQTQRTQRWPSDHPVPSPQTPQRSRAGTGNGRCPS